MVPERAYQRRLPAARPLTPDLISVRRHPAGFFEGQARPGSGRHGEIIGSFLQSDVQGDLETARTLLGEIAAAERGENPQPAGVGNAFSIAITPDGAVILNAVVEGAVPERYRLAELRAALETWIAAIESAPPGRSLTPRASLVAGNIQRKTHSGQSGNRFRADKLLILRNNRVQIPTWLNREINPKNREIKSMIRVLNRPNMEIATGQTGAAAVAG